MSAASQSNPALSESLGQTQPISFHSTSSLLNPQISRLWFRPITSNTFIPFAEATTNSARRLSKDARTVYPATGNGLIKGNNAYNKGESLRENGKYPRPQVVPWQKELANKVDLIGVIGEPLKFKHIQSGKCKMMAWTELGIVRPQPMETMWFSLIFYDELAETAAQYLKQNDQVYVSGRLTLWRQDDKLKVIANTLNFIKKGSLDFSQKVVVDKNTPSPAPSRQAVINRDSPLQYQKSAVKSSSSGKTAQEDGAKIVSLWQAFFANPFEWWDNRTKKFNPKSPDFKHKDSGEGLWIENKHTPLWVRSQLKVLDSKLKAVGKWGEGGSSARSRFSLSSFQSSDL